MDLLGDMTLYAPGLDAPGTEAPRTGAPTITLPAQARHVDLPVLRQRTCELLAAGVPLTLLLDLAEPRGPASAEFYGDELGDTSWLSAR